MASIDVPPCNDETCLSTLVLHTWYEPRMRLAARMLHDAGLLEEFKARIDEPCVHRYPKPNGEGFNVDQCLDCSYWRMAKHLL